MLVGWQNTTFADIIFLDISDCGLLLLSLVSPTMFTKTTFTFFLLLVSLLIYQLSIGYKLERVTSYQKLSWQDRANCRSSGTLAGEGVLIKLPLTVCQTMPFTLQSSELQLELSGNVSLDSVAITMSLDSGEIIPLTPVAQNLSAGKWTPHKLSLPKEALDHTGFLTFNSSSEFAQPGEFFIRNHVYFLNPTNLIGNLFSNIFIKVFSAIFLAIVICRLFLPLIATTQSIVITFVLLFILSIGVHFRFDTFFYWDEWRVLARFAEQGVAGVLQAHNEHYVPLFLFLYYLEALIFNNHYGYYLVFGLFFHTLNCLMIIKIIAKLIAPHKQSRYIASLLGVFYLVGAAHAEVLHWAFTFSIVLSQSLILLAILFIERFIKSGNVVVPVLMAVVACSAPLAFGNGFLVLPFICMFGAYYVLFPNSDLSWRDILPTLAQRIKRLAFSVSIVTLSLMLVVRFYTAISNRGGSAVDYRASLSNVDLLIDYIFVGTWFGTILRGLGLWPIFSMQAHDDLLSRFITFMRPTMFLSWLGVGISILLLISAVLLVERRRYFLLWVIGHCIILGTFVLPALARWQFGVVQALALRYQYLAMFGLLLALLPLVVFLLDSKKQICRTWIIPVLFTAILSGQLILGSTFGYQIDVGRDNIIFADKLVLWAKENEKVGNDITKSYESKGTELEGLYPVMPALFTPGIHPVTIYKTIDWLTPAARN